MTQMCRLFGAILKSSDNQCWFCRQTLSANDIVVAKRDVSPQHASMPGPFFCNQCGKRMFSFTEFVERLGVVYCQDCDPERSPLRLEANSETSKHGYVYILSNPAMPSLLKIGFTSDSVIYRVSQLTSATGVPAPFVLEACFPSHTPKIHERQIHEHLSKYRSHDDREFFKVGLDEAVTVAVAVCLSRQSRQA